MRNFVIISVMVTTIIISRATVFSQQTYEEYVREKGDTDQHEQNVIEAHTYLELYRGLFNRTYGVLYSSGIGQFPDNTTYTVGQTKLMAKRAAKLRAYRAIAISLPGAQHNGQRLSARSMFLKDVAVMNEEVSESDKKAYVDMALFLNITPNLEKHFERSGIEIIELNREEYEQRKKQAQFITQQEWQSWKQ